MAENVVLAPLSTLQNSSIISTVNSNNALIENAFSDCFSLAGTLPNALQSNLDMNNFQIINLPAPATINSPARLVDVAGDIPIIVNETINNFGVGIPADPTATIGLTPINGVATTSIRSDGAPSLSQSIVPTWTGFHTFTGNLSVSFSGNNIFKVNTTTNNVAIGPSSLNNSATGTNNVAIGQLSSAGLTSGGFNVGIGENSLIGTTTGNFNVGIGGFTLAAATTASSQIAIGWQALTASTNINGFNIAIGDSTLKALTSGVQNIAIGYHALISTTTASNCIAIGTNALGTFNLGAGFNGNQIAIGTSAMFALTTGYENVAIGTSVLGVATTSFWNTGVGIQAFQAVSTGNQNTAVGLSCLAGLTTGSNNTAIGMNAGFANTSSDCISGSNNTLLGFNALFGSAVQRNQATVIGANAIGVLFDNSLTLGRVSGGTIDTTYTGPIVTNGPVVLTSYTVATLPVAPGTGAIALVTDQLTVVAAKGTAPTGGGSVKEVVVYTGAGWVSI